VPAPNGDILREIRTAVDPLAQLVSRAAATSALHAHYDAADATHHTAIPPP
jgi:hypothetical protein